MSLRRTSDPDPDRPRSVAGGRSGSACAFVAQLTDATGTSGWGGSVCRIAGQHDRARTRVRRTRSQRGGSHPDCVKGGFRLQIPSLADRQGRPLRLRVTVGPRPDRTQARARVTAGTDAPRSGLRARTGSMPATLGGRGRASRPAGRPGLDARTPNPTIPERSPARRGTGSRLAQTRAARGHTRCPIRAAAPGFAVPSGGWDRAGFKSQLNFARSTFHPVWISIGVPIDLARRWIRQGKFDVWFRPNVTL